MAVNKPELGVVARHVGVAAIQGEIGLADSGPGASADGLPGPMWVASHEDVEVARQRAPVMAPAQTMERRSLHHGIRIAQTDPTQEVRQGQVAHLAAAKYHCTTCYNREATPCKHLTK